MAEPTSSYSFYDLILKVAEEAGIAYYGASGEEPPIIPVDYHDFEACKSIVNTAIKKFIADAPPKGWRWMRRKMSVALTATRITGTVDSASVTTLVDAVLATASGTADSTSATTLVDATLSATYDTDDDLNGKYCYILTGTGAGSYALITDYAAATGTITVADWLTSRGLPGGTDPIATDTFAISDYKVQVGDYCYITAGTGKGSYAIITAFTGANGTITVADWLTEQGSAGGTDPTAGSTYAITPVETVGGDIARYPLPENFGGEVNGQIEYEKSSTHGTSIEWCDESLIRARRSVNVTTGYPKLAAIRPLEYASGGFGPKRRFELIIDPQPSSAEVVEFPYTLYFDKLRMEAGIADAGGATYITDNDRNEPIDFFNDWTATIVSGSAKRAYATVTAYDSREGTATCTDGTAKINVESTGHGMATGDVVTVAGTTDYNGTWTITVVDENNFTFVDTYTSDQSGTWKQRQIEVADWLTDTGVSAGIDPDSTSAYYVEPQANLHPAGFRFDDAILAACLAQAETQLEDVAGNYVQEYMQRALPAAHRIDIRSAPRTLGSMNRYGRQIDRSRNWNNVTTDWDS